MGMKEITRVLFLCMFVFISLFAVSDTVIFNEKSPMTNREKVIVGIQIQRVVKENGQPFAIVDNTPENVKKLNDAGVKFLPDKQNPNLLWLADVAGVLFISDEKIQKSMDISKPSQIKGDMRSMATALEAYFVDNNIYPPCTTDPAQSASPQTSSSLGLPSFRIKNSKYSGMTLTTPIAYLTRFMPDPFSMYPNETFVYYSTPTGWILLSPGPDGKFDINPMQDYNSAIYQPSPVLMLKCYDPTNGETSSGDIFRVKQ